MLLSTSGTRTTPLPHTRDTALVKSKVALRITAAQGVDYYSTARTVPMSLHWEGHRHRTNRRTVVDTLYVVITAPRSRYTCIYFEHKVTRDLKSLINSNTLRMLIEVVLFHFSISVICHLLGFLVTTIPEEEHHAEVKKRESAVDAKDLPRGQALLLK